MRKRIMRWFYGLVQIYRDADEIEKVEYNTRAGYVVMLFGGIFAVYAWYRVIDAML